MKIARAMILAGIIALVPSLAAAETLTTTFVTDNGFDGNMFDVEAKNDLTIQGFACNIDSGTHTIEVYYKAGTFVGAEQDSGSWISLGSVSVTSNGADVATPVPISQSVPLTAGQRYAFYITSTDGSINYLNGTTEGDIFVQDSNLIFYEGIGNSYPFGTSRFSPRVWSGTITYAITQDPPTLGAIADQSSDEDQPISVDVSVADPDTPLGSLIVTATSSNQALIPNANINVSGAGATRTLSLTPADDAVGQATITVTVSDGNSSVQRSFLVTVNEVNDAPSFNAGASVSVQEDSGAYAGPWAGSIVAGPASEAGQTVQFTATPAQPSLFAIAPQISADGTLSFTSAPDAFGATTVTVTARDSGGTGNGGEDTSAPVDFTITISAVNDPPVASPRSATGDEDMQVTITLAATDPEGDMLSFKLGSMPSNGSVAIMGDQLVYTPQANFFGNDTFTVLANDGALDSAPANINVTILPVNDPPSFIAPTPAQSTILVVSEGELIEIDVATDDIDGDIVGLSANGVPPGASWDPAVGKFSWTPQYSDVGAHTLSFIASDGVAMTQRDVVLDVFFLDDDADALPDTWELSVGLDPTTRDSDGDSITDTYEVGADYSMPLDSDDDMIIDALDTDSDDDGIQDGVEAGDADTATPPVDTDLDGTPDFLDTDSDDDGVEDNADNCRRLENPGQADLDADMIGDICDDDVDGDGLTDDYEVAAMLDPRSPDSDGDTILDAQEIGPDPTQPADSDNDMIIDALDEDSDADGVSDADEAGDMELMTPAIDTDMDLIPDYRDTDADDDGVVDNLDNCRLVVNPEQFDTDGNGDGDACDGDVDGDELVNEEDNCPLIANPAQEDMDGDMIGDVCDPDADDDGVDDLLDNCLALENPEQIDTDEDGLGDLCDPDDDGDDRLDDFDNCPLVANPEQEDLDDDKIGDVCDPDVDGDGVEDAVDACPMEHGDGADGCVVPEVMEPDMGETPAPDMGADMAAGGMDVAPPWVDSGVGGCGCSSTARRNAQASLWGLCLLALAGFRRRRRRA